MAVRIDNDTFVLDIEVENSKSGIITLDSGAGCNVWPKGKLTKTPKPGLKILAATGTETQNIGQKVIKFTGVESSADLILTSLCSWQA